MKLAHIEAGTHRDRLRVEQLDKRHALRQPVAGRLVFIQAESRLTGNAVC